MSDVSFVVLLTKTPTAMLDDVGASLRNGDQYPL